MRSPMSWSVPNAKRAGGNERGKAVREPVRSSRSSADRLADQGRPPSAPPVLGLVRTPAFFVAADYPLST
jgi:hypothetical protein